MLLIVTSQAAISYQCSQKIDGYVHKITAYYLYPFLGRGGGLVVSALAYCSEDPRSNPAGYLIFTVRKDKNK